MFQSISSQPLILTSSLETKSYFRLICLITQKVLLRRNYQINKVIFVQNGNRHIDHLSIQTRNQECIEFQSTYIYDQKLVSSKKDPLPILISVQRHLIIFIHVCYIVLLQQQPFLYYPTMKTAPKMNQS